MNHEKMIIVLIQYFADMEGTDYLGERSEDVGFSVLSAEENAELTRLRDIARTNGRWHGY